MFKYFLFALLPSCIPTVLLGIIFAIYIDNINIFYVFGQSFLYAFLNPMTYIFALGIGFTSFKLKTLWKRLLVQIVGFSIIITVIRVFTEQHFELMVIVNLLSGSLFITTFLSLTSLAIEKLYFKFIVKLGWWLSSQQPFLILFYNWWYFDTTYKFNSYWFQNGYLIFTIGTIIIFRDKPVRRMFYF